MISHLPRVTAVTRRENRAEGSSYRNYCCHFVSFGASTVGSTQALCVYLRVVCEMSGSGSVDYHAVIHMQS